MNNGVHTIVLRACGLSREQVLAVQANTVDRRSTTNRHGSQIGVEVHANACGEGSLDNIERLEHLSWHEEKRLGFKAACMRDWLVDAAR